jgi:hypothetical protein
MVLRPSVRSGVALLKESELRRIWEAHGPGKGQPWTELELVIAIQLEPEDLTTRQWMKKSHRAQRFVVRILDMDRSLRPPSGTTRVQNSRTESGTSDMFGYSSGTKKRQQEVWSWAIPVADLLVRRVEEQPGSPQGGITMKTRNTWARQLAKTGLQSTHLEKIIEWLFHENLDSEFPTIVRSATALARKLPNIEARMTAGNGAVRKRHAKPKQPSKTQAEDSNQFNESVEQTRLDVLAHQDHHQPDPNCIRCRLEHKKPYV